MSEPLTEPARARPTLSVIIVLYNSAERVGECLRSILPDAVSGWMEVILVDNSSPDDSAGVSERAMPEARLIALASNRGFAGGANVGIRAAVGRYVLLLNPDVVVPDGALRRLVNWMDSHPGVAAASPDLVGSDGVSGFPGRALPSAWRIALELSRLHKLLPRQLRGKLLRGGYWTGGDQLEVGWVPGTAMITRDSTVRLAGELREDFFMYGEDIEWCRRIRRTAGRIGVCSTVHVTHDWGSSSKLSWGDADAERRVVAGIAAACAVMYGRWHARVIAGLNVLVFLAEASMPGRTVEQRRRAYVAARNWSRCLGVRSPATGEG